MTFDSALPLRDGGAIPVLGFGTWRLRGDEAYNAVRTALDVGYRHVDTATMYENEAEVGRAIADSGVDRADIFVTTKLPPDLVGSEEATIAASLRLLGTEYVDLWLVHWPPNDTAAPDVWEKFLAAKDAGHVRAVGVSNYSTAQIDELIDATGVTPAVNQIPWSPAICDLALIDELRSRGVVLEGYSGLRRSNLDDPTLGAIAAAHGVTVPQVIIRWHIENDYVVIPRSSKPERIASNADVWGFELTEAERAQLAALATPKR